MSRVRKRLVACAATAVVMVFASGLLLATDVYLHSRVQNVGAVNVWGYRGPTVGRKQPNEIRVVVLGGSTAFGYGLPWNEAFPYYLEQMLNETASGPARYRVVNLGAPGQGAFGFRFDLSDYAYLGYDVAVLYEGYNDLGRTDLPNGVPQRDGPNDLLWRRQSPIFRATGYLPVLPLVFREKAMMITAGGDLDGAYRGNVVFKPGLAARATAGALQTAAAIADSLGSAIGRVTANARSTAQLGALDTDTWRHYTVSVVNAVQFARSRSVKVIVVTQPYASDSHIAQQRALADALQKAFGNDRAVRYVNLGPLLSLRDRDVAYDGVHLVAKANRLVAGQLVAPVREIAPAS